MSDVQKNGEAENMLAKELQSAPVKALAWTEDAEHEIELSLQELCKYSGMFNPTTKRLIGGFLRVDKSVRGHKLGERMVRSLVAWGKAQGATSFPTDVESQYGLDVLLNVVGQDVTFSDPDRFKQEPTLNISTDQVRESLVRAEQYEEDPEIRSIGFSLDVDITGLDTTDWQQPQVVEQ